MKPCVDFWFLPRGSRRCERCCIALSMQVGVRNKFERSAVFIPRACVAIAQFSSLSFVFHHASSWLCMQPDCPKRIQTASTPRNNHGSEAKALN